MTSPYSKANYETIAGRNSKNWEDLSGTYAADKNYHLKIFAIAKEFDALFPQQNIDATWFAFASNPDGIMAMNDGDVVDFLATNSTDETVAFFAKHRGAKQWKISNEKLPEKPIESKKRKTTIFLDPGHSPEHPGARSNDGSVREEILNVEACKQLSQKLTELGYSVTTYNPMSDDLTDIGTRARAYDVCISWHFNSYNGHDNPYHCVMTLPSASDSHKQIASRLASAIKDGARNTIVETNLFRGTGKFEGVYEASLWVLKTSQNCDKPPFHALVEAFFLNKFTNEKACIEATKKIANEFAIQLSHEFPN
jgi:N-acetylmuramoyl-L-alanine amidase